MRTGIVDLLLHHGRAPPWLLERMRKLGGAICEAITDEYGERELLRRLSKPLWFQALSYVLGYDWNSSGTTTVTTAVLKSVLRDEIRVAGGKGRTALRTPQELREIAREFGLDEEGLVKTSKLVAKVDNSLIQDGYQLYHHAFFISREGDWTVIQQGMKGNLARRYHWFNEAKIGDEHGIMGLKEEKVLNLASERSEEVRKDILDFVKERHAFIDGVNWEALKEAYELQPKNFEEFLLIRGIGPKTLRSLALVSKVIYGSELDWRDPVKYTFAFGGKDGVPYPVNKRLMDEVILTLREALDLAKAGKNEKKEAIKRLSVFKCEYE